MWDADITEVYHASEASRLETGNLRWWMPAIGGGEELGEAASGIIFDRKSRSGYIKLARDMVEGMCQKPEVDIPKDTEYKMR